MYIVKYKKVNGLFWKKLKKVKGDGMIDETSGFVSSIPDTNMAQFNHRTNNTGRWFILEDETRVEIPTAGMVFQFSKERHYMIKEQMAREAGKSL